MIKLKDILIVFTKMFIKAGAVIFIIGCLFQIISMFYNNELLNYFSRELSKNGFKNISYLLFMISLAIWNISFYYYYFAKKFELVLMAFLFCDFVICVPFLFIWAYLPHHKMRGLTFILGITFIIILHFFISSMVNGSLISFATLTNLILSKMSYIIMKNKYTKEKIACSLKQTTFLLYGGATQI
ncbi:hypothetical protein ACYUJ6_16295 [Clostridium sp. JNZ X4-2]